MSVIWQLFLGFFRVGCFAFGGAYGAIPLIRDVVLSHGWLDDETLTYFIAVSESTPGPIMVNLATYIGSAQGGFWGAAMATAAVTLPSFTLILIIIAMMKNAVENQYVKTMLGGVKPCIAGIILATGGYMTVKGCAAAEPFSLDVRGAVITAVLAGALLACGKRKKKMSPIVLILLSACLGICLYGM